MGKKSKKNRPAARRNTTAPARVMPKSKAINPLVITIVAVAMLIALAVPFALGVANPTAGTVGASTTGASTNRTGANISSDPAQTQKLQDITQQLETLNADPNNLGALINLGNDYFDTNQFQKAIDTYGKALDLAPGNTNVRVDRGFAYYNLTQYSQAIAEYRKALEVDPQKPEAHLNLGAALIADSPANVDEAISEWQKALQFAGNNQDVVKKAQDQINRYKK